MSLAAAIAPRVYVTISAGEVLVPPPPFGVAITLLEAATESDGDAAQDALASWLPESVRADLRLRERDTQRRATERLIWAGVPGASERKRRIDPRMAAQMPEQEKPGPTDWMRLAARYAAAFGVKPGDVLSEPFPLVLAMSRELPALEAQRVLEGAQAAGLGQGGRKAARALKQLQKVASSPAAS